MNQMNPRGSMNTGGNFGGPGGNTMNNTNAMAMNMGMNMNMRGQMMRPNMMTNGASSASTNPTVSRPMNLNSTNSSVSSATTGRVMNQTGQTGQSNLSMNKNLTGFTEGSTSNSTPLFPAAARVVTNPRDFPGKLEDKSEKPVKNEESEDDEEDDDDDEDEDDKYPFSDGKRVYLDEDSTLMTSDLEASCEEVRARLAKYALREEISSHA